ncbi:methyltransferase domain-containing protein [Ornithinimicrobium sp. F0845]|uniref:methyltransferase domain-containing protein n=1 Tax=Ornithinimicrobium sp. F0845 TaxID=2926412 RepID=UPI001FF17C43|nr:methyltransferase domain-containing protein [Ornithinimicrobium sp. F0845]MCK0113191.1 methyltransferase domain-containing protein [Ornithinimicrobium sp. F0845]
MQCDYFDAGRCRSCTLMGTAYSGQLADKQARCVAALGPGPRWAEPFASRPAGFRNKAKLVVGGHRGAPTVGILDRGGRGVDLRHCGLYEDGLAEVVEQVPALVGELGLVPYDVPRRSGELKHVLITHSPAGELMVRFVLRSPGQLGRIRRGLPALRDRWPTARVVSVNLQPAHAAVLEGPEEIVLTEDQELPMVVNDVRLRLRARSFFQTNTAVAAGLYRQAREWIDEVDPPSLWDLYCGVGGFALHALQRPDASARDVLGVEVSPEAVESARAAAADLPGASRFVAGDVIAHLQTSPSPDLVVVNPPRRGIGTDLAAWLEESGVEHVLYSSCNVDSLAGDLARMPSLVPVRARLFDMFPQTPHLEVLTLLHRAG